MHTVIQGSKIANLLYTLYINELPAIYKLFNTNYYTSLTDLPILNFNNVKHVTVNFVDDSSNIIGFSKFTHVEPYLESYYSLIHKFYNINKLQINDDKNQLTINAKAIFKNQVNTFTFNANQFQIKQKSKS